jgi:hypothetical protein
VVTPDSKNSLDKLNNLQQADYKTINLFFTNDDYKSLFPGLTNKENSKILKDLQTSKLKMSKMKSNTTDFFVFEDQNSLTNKKYVFPVINK